MSEYIEFIKNGSIADTWLEYGLKDVESKKLTLSEFRHILCEGMETKKPKIIAMSR